MGSLLAAALTRAQDFLLEPVGVLERPGVARTGGSSAPIEIAVLGTRTECGVSTVASGLALALAENGHSNTLVREVPSRVAVGVETAEAVVLVASGSGDPPIAGLVASLLKERIDRLLLVANRVKDENAWNGQADVCIPESRFGAALVARGRRPLGLFGAAFVQLALLVEQDLAA